LETFGFARLGIGGRVERVSRELEEWLAGRGHVFAGALVGEPGALEPLARGGFHEALDSLAREGVLGAVIWQGDWAEVAYPWDLLEARRLVLDEETTRIAGGARVHPTAYIGRGVVVERGAVVEARAVVEGPAYIGRGARVGAGAVVKASILEEYAEAAENSVVVESHLLEGASVGPTAVAYRTIAAEHSRVGPGAKLLDEPLHEPPPRLKGLAPRVPRGLRLGPIIAPGEEVEANEVLTPSRQH